jgi:hypothetical protein
MSKIYGEELRKAVLATKKRMQDAIDRRSQRIANWETDEDDCFISQRVEERAICECNMQLKILDGDGTQEWDVVLDHDGKEVRTHWFTNKWGKSTIVGNGVFTSSLNALLKKTGWREAKIRVPVWTKFVANGSGMMGVYCGSYEVVRWHTNMVTGEYVGYPD